MTQQQELQKLIDELRAQKSQMSEERMLVAEIQKARVSAMAPILTEMAQTIAGSVKQALSSAISGIRLEAPTVTVEAPQPPNVIIPPFKIPTPQVTVSVPKNDELLKELKSITKAVSTQQVPFADQIAEGMKSIDFRHPLPVILTDHEGKPYIAGSFGGRSGGGMVLHDEHGNVATIKSLTDNIKALNVAIFDSTGAQVDTFGGTITNTVTVKQLSGAEDSVVVNSFLTSLETKQVSGAVDSVSLVGTPTLDVKQVSGSEDSVVVNSFVTSLEVKQVSGTTDSVNVLSTVGLTDAQLRAATLDVKQVSGSSDSVNVTQFGGNTIATNIGDVDAGTLRTVLVKSPNATTAAVSVGADASTNIVPTQLSRKSIVLVHTSTSNLYIATGTAASTTSTPIVANQFFGFDEYTGPINAIAEEQAGTISVRYIEIV